MYDSEFFNFLHIIYYMKINKNNFYDQVVLNIATLLRCSVEFSTFNNFMILSHPLERVA